MVVKMVVNSWLHISYVLQRNCVITPKLSFKNSTHLLSGVRNLSTA